MCKNVCSKSLKLAFLAAFILQASSDVFAMEHNQNPNAIEKETAKIFDQLHLAVRNGDTEAVELLIKNGAVLMAVDIVGQTALHWAAQSGHTEIVEFLINAGADVNARDNGNITALVLAAINGHTEIVKLLINAGADVNIANYIDGATALHCAAQNGHIEIVEFLINAGADVNARDREGKTVLNWASLRLNISMLPRPKIYPSQINLKEITAEKKLQLQRIILILNKKMNNK